MYFEEIPEEIHAETTPAEIPKENYNTFLQKKKIQATSIIDQTFNA